MGEVIGFKPKDSDLEPLWMCPCGHKKFGLVQGGSIRCWQCGKEQELRHAPERNEP